MAITYEEFVVGIRSGDLIDERYTHLDAEEKRKAAYHRLSNMISAMQVCARVELQLVTIDTDKVSTENISLKQYVVEQPR